MENELLAQERDCGAEFCIIMGNLRERLQGVVNERVRFGKFKDCDIIV